MIDKIVDTVARALDGIADGAVVAVGGFGDSGVPGALLTGLLEAGISGLTIISNNAGTERHGLSALFAAKRVRKIVCSFPRSTGSVEFDRQYAAGLVELEVVPQGTLSERLRAAAAGLGGFYTPTGAGTLLARDKECRDFDGRSYLLERPLQPDVALVRGDRADRFGNLTHHSAARNFGPVMAAAAKLSIAEVRAVVPLGELDPEIIVTPGIFVDRVVEVG
ncbi:MAG: 3-oxoacid CoA-transferase subunit A [Candidatus Velthaea sp.]|jgi:3-oxoadipate CoA-transferase alpha subunit